jgi:5-methylcytosine-specific restriction endonuclease McrBC regulatory subunit McrC
LELPNSGDAGKSGLAEWLLIFLWKIKLKNAYRLGLPKQYVSKSQKTVVFQGNLNITSAIRNPLLIPPYDCTYRKHSYDNSVTRLIANTFRLIRNKELVQDCHKLRQDFSIATEGKKVSINDLMVKNEVKNPYYKDYNMVAELSRRIIKREMADFSSDKDDFSAFFFDISMLFEHFIRKVLIRKGHILEVKNKEQYTIPSGGNNNNGNRKLFPDLIIKNDDGSINVYDVKYKRYDFTYGINREDLFQVNTYVGQLLNENEVKKCGFIFPIEEDKINNITNPIIQELNIAGRNIIFEVHFFCVPNENSESYSKTFQNNIENFYKK